MSDIDHRFLLAEDFTTLRDWETWGISTADYDLSSLYTRGHGCSLWVSGEGAFRITRPAPELKPGSDHVAYAWVYAAGSGSAPNFQIQESSEPGTPADSVFSGSSGAVAPGWNRLVMNFHVPASWRGCWIRFHRATGADTDDTWWHQLRILEAEEAAL